MVTPTRASGGTARKQPYKWVRTCPGNRLDPEFADAYCDRGQAHLARRACDAAVRDFTEVLQRHPGSAEAYQNRGV